MRKISAYILTLTRIKAICKTSDWYATYFTMSASFRFPKSEQEKLSNIRSERPNEVYETLHDSPSVIVWFSTYCHYIIGPWFFKIRKWRETHIKECSDICISRISRLPEKHEIATRGCTSTLLQRSKTIFG